MMDGGVGYHQVWVASSGVGGWSTRASPSGLWFNLDLYYCLCRFLHEFFPRLRKPHLEEKSPKVTYK